MSKMQHQKCRILWGCNCLNVEVLWLAPVVAFSAKGQHFFPHPEPKNTNLFCWFLILIHAAQYQIKFKEKHAYHNPISKSLNSHTGNRGTSQLQGPQVPGKHQGDKAKHVVENGGNDGRPRQEPEKPGLPPKQPRPPSNSHWFLGQELLHCKGRQVWNPGMGVETQ